MSGCGRTLRNLCRRPNESVPCPAGKNHSNIYEWNTPGCKKRQEQEKCKGGDNTPADKGVLHLDKPDCNDEQPCRKHHTNNSKHDAAIDGERYRQYNCPQQNK